LILEQPYYFGFQAKKMMKQPVGSLKPYQRSKSALKSSQTKTVKQLRQEAVALYA